MKTSELTGAALDWAVAQCEYVDARYGFDDNCPEYSTNWAQGGPIIEREGIQLARLGDVWEAWVDADGVFCQGSTPLIAAMRCYVASVMGDEVDVPEELLEQEEVVK